MKVPGWVVATIFAVCLISGCAQPPSAGTADERRMRRVAEIEAMFDQRARHLSNRNIDAYLHHVDPPARATEEALAGAFLSLPLAAPSFQVRQSSILSPTFPADGISVRFQYRYQSLSAGNAFSFPITYRLVSRDGQIRIAESSPGPTDLPIWASGPVQTYESQHFLALGRPGIGEIDSVLKVAEAARAALEPRLPVPLDDRNLIVLARNQEEFARLVSTGTLDGADRVAQVGTVVQVTPQKVAVDGRHIVVNLEQLAENRTGPETFKHELAHLALALETRPTTPGWVAEGAAMYLAGDRPVETWRDGSLDGDFEGIRISRLSGAASLGGHESGPSASAEYAYSAAAAWYLVETFGPERFWRFYRSFAERPANELYEVLSGNDAESRQAVGILGAELTTQALAAIYQLEPAQLDSEISGWMMRQPG